MVFKECPLILCFVVVTYRFLQFLTVTCLYTVVVFIYGYVDLKKELLYCKNTCILRIRLGQFRFLRVPSGYTDLVEFINM